MVDRAQIGIENELQRCAHQGASELVHCEAPVDITRIFDLGSSGGSNIARDKDLMIAEAFHALQGHLRQR
jgi:hypothetical protein